MIELFDLFDFFKRVFDMLRVREKLRALESFFWGGGGVKVI